MLQLFHASKAMQVICADILHNKLSHAYLAVFPDRQYLKLLLNEIAKQVMRADERIARLIDAGQFVDCKLYPQEDKKLLVSTVMDIIDDCYLFPLESDKKVYILSDMQTMTIQAQNKLLKLLEEPPKSVHFILGSTQLQAILPTIQSRTKILHFGQFSSAELLDYLDRNYKDIVNKQELVLLANGSISSLQQLLKANTTQFAPQTILKTIAALQAEDCIALAKEYTDSESVVHFFSVLQIVLRELLLYHIGNKKSSIFMQQSGSNQTICQEEIAKYLQLAAKRYKPQRILLVLDEIVQAVHDLENNGNLSQTMYIVLLTLLEGK